MDERTCSVDGCEGPHGRITAGMCSKHYQRLRTYGTTVDRPPRRWVMCGHRECSRQARSGGLCRSHAAGSEGPLSHQQHRLLPGASYCAFPNCDEPHKTGGFCRAHNEQSLRGLNAGPACTKSGCGAVALTRGLCLKHLRFRYMTLRQYGMTIDQYDALLQTQSGCCAICKGVNANGNWLAVDHDHSCCPTKGTSCGRCIRALLCGNCNLMIGQSGDAAERLRAGAEYLDQWNAREVMRAV